MSNLTEEEKYIADAIISARKIQEFLWGECNGEWGLEEWKRMFKKRIIKIDDIKPNNPHAIVELKKRILQNTALGIAMLKIIDNPDMANNLLNDNCGIPSNLSEYK